MTSPAAAIGILFQPAASEKQLERCDPRPLQVFGTKVGTPGPLLLAKLYPDDSR